MACMKDGEANVLSIDVESNNPSRGPLRVCAFVLMSYRKLFQYEIIDRVQFIVERSADEYDEDGRIFWKEKAIAIDRYFDSPNTVRLSPSNAAKHIRAYLDHCWATVPRMAILVDEPQTDHALLYEFLKAHGHRPMCYDAKSNYKRNVHVARDLMRGAFSMIDSRFVNLEESDMYLYIHRYWQELVIKQAQQQQDYQNVGWTAPPTDGISTTVSRSSEVMSINERCIFTQLGPEMKHVPVFDATQSLLIWAKMEDIKRLFHTQLLKIAITAPSLLILPKPGIDLPNPIAVTTTTTMTTNTHPLQPFALPFIHYHHHQ